MLQEPLKPARWNRSSRSRPSLAAIAGSGYEPPKPKETSRSGTLPLSASRDSNVLSELQEDPFDLGVASKLLGDEPHTKDPRASVRLYNRSMRTARSFLFGIDGEHTVSKSTSSSSVYPPTGTISRSQTISSAWSGMSHRLVAESISGAATERNTDVFTKQFDKLARKHGIQPFPESHHHEPGTMFVSSASQDKSSEESTPVLSGNKLWNMLLRRTPSNVDIPKHYGNMKLSLSRKRGSNISELAAIGRGKRDSLKGMHLEDFVRLGGVSPFSLPPELTPGDLLIPTCMHATASYILNHGLKTPGLFRVSGNLNTTYALYDYYQKQFEEDNNEPVVQTIALAKLPSHIRYHVHDIAHLFKKLLYCLPGGLLGSPPVFQALYSIHSLVYPDPSPGDHMSRKVKPRMIALALASINLHFRISLICAVFGLLRAVSLASKQEGSLKSDPHEAFTAMKEDALGIIFGPLLLGDKSDQILLSELEDRGGLPVPPKVTPTANASLKLGKYTNRHSSAYTKMQMEKTKRAALVCEMLINGWEDICYQLKNIDALGITAKAYDLPSLGEETHSNDRGRNSSAPLVHGVGTPPVRDRGYGTARGKAPSEGGSACQHQRHHLQAPTLHKPHLEDLVRFSTHSPVEQEHEQMFSTPLMAQKAMSPVPELSPDMHSVDSSPNWRIISPETPVRNRKGSTGYRRPAQITRSTSVATAIQTEGEGVGSGVSSKASSPGLEVAAQAATRLRRALLEDKPEPVEMVLGMPEDLKPSKQRKQIPKSSLPKLGTEIPELAFTPKSKLFDPSEFSLDDTTPKPLNIRNKTKAKAPPAFSIFEDWPRIEPPSSPTRPNSKVDVRLTPKAPPKRAPAYQPESPTRPPSAPLQPATPNRRPRASIDSDFEDRYIWRSADSPSPGKKTPRGNSALYAEIRRLQRLVDAKTEEANAARKELELAQNMANAGTLNYMLRESQEEAKIWRNRAEWAEKQLRNKEAADRKSIDFSNNAGLIGAGRYSLG